MSPIEKNGFDLQGFSPLYLATLLSTRNSEKNIKRPWRETTSKRSSELKTNLIGNFIRK